MALPSIITEEIVRNVTNLNNTAYHAEHEDEEEPTNDLVVAKVTSILVLGIVSFLIGILPIQLTKWFSWNLEKTGGGRSLVVSLLLCFGGGVLMFTTFLHLQPEVRESMEALYKKGILPEMAESVQLPELIFCVGFFFVYLIEEVVHSVLDHKHVQTEEEVILHRTMSLRRCSRKGTHDPPTLIPRVSLAQTEVPNKSISTQVLLDSSNSSTVTDNNLPDLEYLPKVLDPELVLNYPKVQSIEVNPKFIMPAPSHSHILYEDESQSSTSEDSNKFAKSVRAFCTIMALSFHAVFEGLAVGLEDSVTNVWYLTLAVAAHKFVISFCVGVELLSSKTRMFLIFVYLGTFAIVTPIGIGIGIGLSHNNESPGGELVSVVLQGMAAGTLLYVVFFEVLQRERSNHQSGILQLIAIMAGFGVMFGLQVLSKSLLYFLW